MGDPELEYFCDLVEGKIQPRQPTKSQQNEHKRRLRMIQVPELAVRYKARHLKSGREHDAKVRQDPVLHEKKLVQMRITAKKLLQRLKKGDPAKLAEYYARKKKHRDKWYKKFKQEANLRSKRYYDNNKERLNRIKRDRYFIKRVMES